MRAGSGPASRRKSAEKAKYWFPPYEFYPMGDSASGVPHTDECTPSFDRQRALAVAEGGIPFRAVQQALWFLGLTDAPRWATAAGPAEFKAMARFQATMGDAPDGHLNRRSRSCV